MRPALLAGLVYFAVVFAAGFALGVPRTLVLEARVGELGAVLVEMPVILAVCWWSAGRVARRFAVPGDVRARVAMGGAAFALLMAAEWALVAATGEETLLEHWSRPAGLLGLAGQLAFAAFPAIRGRGERATAGTRPPGRGSG